MTDEEPREMERQIADMQRSLSTLTAQVGPLVERVAKLEVMRDVDSKRIDQMDAKLTAMDAKLDAILLKLSRQDGEQRGQRRAWGWVPWLGGAAASAAATAVAQHVWWKP